MTLPVSNLVEQMSQLDAARNLVLSDSAFYPQIVNGILPIIGPSARLELRRWGAEFLAETFASPAFAQTPKQKLSTEILPTVQELLDIPGEDPAVVKGAVQTAASIYPLIFRHMYVDSHLPSSSCPYLLAVFVAHQSDRRGRRRRRRRYHLFKL
jgi:symplekin